MELDGVVYPSVEHAYQAAKTEDPAERALIRTAKTSGHAKRLGRRVTLRSDWERIKLSVMLALVTFKFTNNAELRRKLLATGEVELVEGNWWNDTFWGVSETSGRGENHLGKILMLVRKELKSHKARV